MSTGERRFHAWVNFTQEYELAVWATSIEDARSILEQHLLSGHPDLQVDNLGPSAAGPTIHTDTMLIEEVEY